VQEEEEEVEKQGTGSVGCCSKVVSVKKSREGLGAVSTETVAVHRMGLLGWAVCAAVAACVVGVWVACVLRLAMAWLLYVFGWKRPVELCNHVQVVVVICVECVCVMRCV